MTYGTFFKVIMPSVNETLYTWLTKEIDARYESRNEFAEAADISSSLVSRVVEHRNGYILQLERERDAATQPVPVVIRPDD